MSENRDISQDEQLGNQLCFLIGDREHMIRVFQAEIHDAHRKLAELRAKITQEKAAEHAAQAPAS